MKETTYIRKCKNCGENVFHKNRRVFISAVRLDKICKICSNKITNKNTHEKSIKYWESIVGFSNIKKNTLKQIKRHWKTLDDNQRNIILLKTPEQRKYYWGHLKRKNRSLKSKKCRETMKILYSGDNHWMKRPDVIFKVRKSMEKYRGENHWFFKKKLV